MLFIFCILFSIPHLSAFIVPDSYTKFSKLYFSVPGPFGPDSVSLDPNNQGPYAGVSDGRILKFNGTDFVDFAYLFSNRSKQLCDGVTNISLFPICGRALGFSFDPLRGDLYVVGAYGGFYRVGPQGGQATLLATNANGVPFNFLAGIDYDTIRNNVYFTDTSLVTNFTDAFLGIPTPPGDSSGRLLEYNTRTGQVRVLLNNVTLPGGLAISAGGTFIVYSSISNQQVYKYYLIGPKAGTTQVLIPELPGYPLKIKRAPELGLFWVTVNVVVPQQPFLVHAYGYKFTSNGEIILIKNFTAEYGNAQVNVVQEYFNLLGGTLYVGSSEPSVNYVGVYTK